MRAQNGPNDGLPHGLLNLKYNYVLLKFLKIKKAKIKKVFNHNND